eukprot:gb/GECG01016051.1/.p1 GENE.gb/GECG01016051.1/~~gb/GECG01016051.1/.p1  ORF type:complete len:820 (+),score=95.18 gb/GECG01016051.1/:1-2460(+)
MSTRYSDDGEAVLREADAEQAKLMKEQVILVDKNDNVLGGGSKKETHVWSNIQQGMLHRAFSVFLFTPEGKLMLQRRASSKITFPDYWANTCCSHPLFCEEELETENALGVKRAARRKMEQELGINPDELPLSCFEFVTRIHYSAPCGEHGKPANYWGEHEVDHVLICMPPRCPRLHINENEVREVRYFTPTELAEWVSSAQQNGRRVSPWFRLMERTMLYKWWRTVARGLSSIPEIAEWDTIHRLDSNKKLVPSDVEVLEAARGAEEAWDSAKADHDGSAVAKQGAYGKIVTHQEPLLKQIMHVDELFAVFLHKTKLSESARVCSLPANASDAQKWCEKMLGKVSRSFATVIQQLNYRLRSSVCVFYLVLRALDTIEDDMMAFTGREKEKLAHLENFYKNLNKPSWSMKGVGEGHEAVLLENFSMVIQFFSELEKSDRDVIQDVCAKMGKGMAKYVSRDLREGTKDIDDYNLYCHYVAGLVGQGLSSLFSSSGCEDEYLSRELNLANEMGLFLQKTNIIRDYLEDLVDLRAFWPRSVWMSYGIDKLADLRGDHGPSMGDGKEAHKPHPRSREVLNHLVADALSHAPSCLEYLRRLRSDDVFRFCAIPQVMAIATLDKLTNNEDVFTGVVKIRKAQALRLMQHAGTMQNVASIFLKHARSIASKVPMEHRQAYTMVQEASRKTQEAALSFLPPVTAAFKSNVVLSRAFSLPTMGMVVMMFISLCRYLYSRTPEWAMQGRYTPRLTDSWDVAALAAVTACVVYLLAFTGVPLVMSAQQLPRKGESSRWSDSDEVSDEADSPTAESSPVPSKTRLRRRLSH